MNERRRSYGRWHQASGLETSDLYYRQWWPLALLLLLFAAGCGPLKDDTRQAALENTLSSYRQAIRWGHYPAAAGFLSPESRTELDLDALSNIRVTGYEVVRQGVIGPDDNMLQLVQIEYVREDRQQLERLLDHQHWRYDASQRAWWLASGLPEFLKTTAKSAP